MIKASQLKAIAFHLSPKPVKEWLVSFNENRKMEHWKKCYKTKVSKEQVDEVFSLLDLDSDVIVHSSLPDIGNIKLRDVTDNLNRYVLDKGHTILCPALPIKGSSLEYLKSIKEFDVRTASNAMGAISTYYGRQEGAVRSLSPTHSVIAVGEKAVYYTEEHHLAETPFTETSPYYKLIVNRGKILLFGATFKNLTFVHVLEDIIGEDCYPVKMYDPRMFEIKVVDGSGVSHYGSFRAHSYRNSVLNDGEELYSKVLSLPSTIICPIGCSEVILLDARDTIICMLENLSVGITRMGRRRISECCRQKAEYWIKQIEQS